MTTDYEGPGSQAEYTWTWFDKSPMTGAYPTGETYGVRHGDTVICYTNRFKSGYEDAVAIAAALNRSGGQA